MVLTNKQTQKQTAQTQMRLTHEYTVPDGQLELASTAIGEIVPKEYIKSQRVIAIVRGIFQKKYLSGII